MQNYFIKYFIYAFLLSISFTFFVRQAAKKLNIVDQPNKERKIHEHSTPLLGGVAIFVSFFLVLFFARQYVLSENLTFYHWLGFFVGSLFLIVGGVLDDKYDLKPHIQIIFPILAVAAVIFGGLNIEKISSPFGGFIFFTENYFSYILIFGWLITVMYATKLLDGIDGLVSGVSAIGGLIIFLFTMTTKYYQPDIGLAALIFAAACFGFLIFNWHPASIFLGESGSLLLGFIIGVLAIISGGKIAIALLIIGMPILDVFWTIFRRLISKKNPFKSSDKDHLHYKLLGLGIGQRKTVLIYYFISFIFGFSGLFLQSKGKLLALIFLFVFMSALIIVLPYFQKNNHEKKA